MKINFNINLESTDNGFSIIKKHKKGVMAQSIWVPFVTKKGKSLLQNDNFELIKSEKNVIDNIQQRPLENSNNILEYFNKKFLNFYSENNIVKNFSKNIVSYLNMKNKYENIELKNKYESKFSQIIKNITKNNENKENNLIQKINNINNSKNYLSNNVTENFENTEIINNFDETKNSYFNKLFLINEYLDLDNGNNIFKNEISNKHKNIFKTEYSNNYSKSFNNFENNYYRHELNYLNTQINDNLPYFSDEEKNKNSELKYLEIQNMQFEEESSKIDFSHELSKEPKNLNRIMSLNNSSNGEKIYG